MRLQDNVILITGGSRGVGAACAEACADAGHQAILFGDLEDPKSSIAQRLTAESSSALRPDLGLNAAVRYQDL